MNIGKPKDIINTYLDAESTLEEGENLFDSESAPPEIAKWSTYIDHHRKKAPPHLKDSIRTAIKTRRRKKRQRLAGLVGVAASIVVFMVFTMPSVDDGDTRYNEKKAALLDALSMFPEEKDRPKKQSIIYEDDLVVIYMN